MWEFFHLLIFYSNKLKIEDDEFILNAIENKQLDEYEIEVLLEVIQEFKVEGENILSEVKERVEIYLQDQLEDQKEHIKIEKYIRPASDYDGEIEYMTDESGIKEELDLIFETISSNFNEEILKKLHIDRFDIVQSIDIDEMKDKYLEGSGEDYAYDNIRDYRGNFSGDDIDAIFERS